MLQIFTAEECQLLLGGKQGVDDKVLADWRKNTSYSSPYADDHKVIKWFWEVLKDGDSEFRASLLWFQVGPPSAFGPSGPFSFCVGSTGVPLSRSLPGLLNLALVVLGARGLADQLLVG